MGTPAKQSTRCKHCESVDDECWLVEGSPSCIRCQTITRMTCSFQDSAKSAVVAGDMKTVIETKKALVVKGKGKVRPHLSFEATPNHA